MLHKPQHLNPAETARFQQKMATLPPAHQADVALKWRERFVNVANTYAPGPLGTTAQVVGSGVYAGMLGYWDGVNEAERNHAKETWQTKTAPELGIDTTRHPEPFSNIVDPTTGAVVHKAQSDPRNWMGVNKTVAPTLGLGLAAIIMSAVDVGDRAVPYIKSLVFTGVGYVVGTSIRDQMYKRRRDALRAAAATEPATPVAPAPTEEGGDETEGNPRRRRRYPRAA